MEDSRVISTTTIQAPSSNIANSPQTIHLTPWDLRLLTVDYNQKGLLFRSEKHTPNQIEHLQRSLSSTLAFFPPLAGRLVIIQHHDDNTVSSHIVCNNAGALFVHAIASNSTVADILQPKYVPPIVNSFFPLNGVKNYEGTSQPLLAVQVTELADGIFIALTINHVVVDGKSIWHFVNSWAEISRGSPQISTLPVLERFFLDGIDSPIWFPFTKEEERSQNLKPQAPPAITVRVFHFTKKKIAELKSKANAETCQYKQTNNTVKISSLQVLLTFFGRLLARCQQVEPHEVICFMMGVGARPRMVPALAEDYFGNASVPGRVTMKVAELLSGLGKGALEINKMISQHSHQTLKHYYESWVKTPMLLKLPSNSNTTHSCGVAAAVKHLAVSSSPRFNIYGNDFGWGKPVAVRSGSAYNASGKITMFAGADEGSIDIELCLPYEISEAMGNDPELMDAMSEVQGIGK